MCILCALFSSHSRSLSTQTMQQNSFYNFTTRHLALTLRRRRTLDEPIVNSEWNNSKQRNLFLFTYVRNSIEIFESCVAWWITGRILSLPFDPESEKNNPPTIEHGKWLGVKALHSGQTNDRVHVCYKRRSKSETANMKVQPAIFSSHSNHSMELKRRRGKRWKVFYALLSWYRFPTEKICFFPSSTIHL